MATLQVVLDVFQSSGIGPRAPGEGVVVGLAVVVPPGNVSSLVLDRIFKRLVSGAKLDKMDKNLGLRISMLRRKSRQGLESRDEVTEAQIRQSEREKEKEPGITK